MFDRFRAFSPTRQILLIASAVFVIGGLLTSIWFLWLRTNYQPLFSNLAASDAAVIVADLDRKKIPYRLAEGGTVILVPEDRLDATRLNVLTEDLPLRGTVGFELFNKSDMGLTDFAQKINYQRALQGELARTIMTLDGVETARVHLSMGEDRIFRDDRVPPKASVTIRMKRGVHLSTRVAQGIQRLIAGAVPKLEISNVVVLDEAGQVVGAPPRLPNVADAASPMAQEMHAIEQYYVARIKLALDGAYPRDSFSIGVSATIPTEGIGEASGTAALSSWTPQARKFPLLVTVSPATQLDDRSRENLRSLVATALGTAAVEGDVVTIDAVHDVAEASLTDSAQEPFADSAGRADVRRVSNPPAISPIADGEPDWFLEGGLSLLLLLVMLAGFFFLLRQARGPRRLTDRQRADFAVRLRAALEQRSDRVASYS